MRVKSLAIVLHSSPYSENSLVVKLFCRELGLRGYLVSRKAAGLYQPLNLLDAVVYESKPYGLHRMAEAKFEVCFHRIATDPSKMPTAFFLTEFLYKALKEESPNQGLFDFVAQKIFEFDRSTERLPDFHLQFVMGFLTQTGLGGQSDEWVEILNAENELAPFIRALAEKKLFPANKYMRNRVLNLLLQFATHHFHGLGDIKSVEILKDVSESVGNTKSQFFL